MDQRTIQVLFALLHSAISGTKITEEGNNCSSELVPELLEIAAKHDVVHLLALGLKRNGLIHKENIDINKYILSAVYRYEQLRYEYDNLCNALEKAHIPFLPLKGSVIRKHYPEAWMRTSCDIDILVHEEDLKRAIKVLVSELGYKNEGRGYHDVSLFSPNNVHVELHFTLLDEMRFPATVEIITGVCEQVLPVQEGRVQMQMPDELYYFYHILHMAKHLCGGGCGIRPFLDLWILDHKVEHDARIREALLQKGGLLTFAQAAQSLSEVWFSGQVHTELTKKMERFILGGGVYGNAENMAAVQQVKKGGRIQSILYKIFLPYSLLKGHYPILQKHKWLLPFCQVVRWFRLLSAHRWRRSLHELKTNAEISTEQISSAADLLKGLGL